MPEVPYNTFFNIELSTWTLNTLLYRLQQAGCLNLDITESFLPEDFILSFTTWWFQGFAPGPFENYPYMELMIEMTNTERATIENIDG